jgi:hypothetical protein
MPDLEVKIFNQKINLSYQENEKQRLIIAVEKLNKSWNKFSDLHGKVSDFKIITLISLELQDSIADIEALKNKISESDNIVEMLKKGIEVKNKELKDKLETIKKLELELNKNNKEISMIEYILDELHQELLQIKNSLLKNTNE